MYILYRDAEHLVSEITRDLQTAGIDIPRRFLSEGPASLSAFTAVTGTVLTALNAGASPA
jgi:hypothetical protein